MTTTLALIGASCTGKSTLWSAASRPGNVILVPEAARAYFGEHPEIDETDRFQLPAQRAIQERAICNEMNAMERAHIVLADLVVCDRSVFDAPAYVYATGNPRGADRLLARVSRWRYDHLVYPDPADVAYQTDEVRKEPAVVRDAIHRGFVEFLQTRGISYTMVSGTLDERLERLIQLVAGASQR